MQDYLRGLHDRPHGTSKTTFEDGSVAFTSDFSMFGVQIGGEKQYVLRHGNTRKQNLVNRWKLSSDYVPPTTLLLRCGLELSLCTRNARRCRVIDILKSDVLRKRRDSFPWPDQVCATEFAKAFNQSSRKAFIDLYESSDKERQAHFRSAISSLLEALRETGLQNGVLASNAIFYTYLEGSDDPESLISLSSKGHAWAGLIEDTVETATLTTATRACLSFPYRGLPGQRRRLRAVAGAQYSVLERKIRALPPPIGPLLSPRSWIKQLTPKKVLQLEDTPNQILKFMERLPKEELRVRWSNKNIANMILMTFPGTSDIYRFRELMDVAGVKEEDVTRVYVISKSANEIPPPQRPRYSGRGPCSKGDQAGLKHNSKLPAGSMVENRKDVAPAVLPKERNFDRRRSIPPRGSPIQQA